MNTIRTKSTKRKSTKHTNVNQCVYCNANYRSLRKTSKYCSSTCRAKAWKERQAENTGILHEEKDGPELNLSPIFYDKFYQKIHQLYAKYPEERDADKKAYLHEINCGYETAESILKELDYRIRYNLTFDDYRKVCSRKYGDSMPVNYQITYSDVIRQLPASENEWHLRAMDDQES